MLNVTMAATLNSRRGSGSFAEQTIYEASEQFGEKLIKIVSLWQNLKANYIHFTSSITLAYPLCRNPTPLSEVTSLSLEDVKKCYEAVQKKSFTESAFVIDSFLHLLDELKYLYNMISQYRPTLVASQDSKKARFVREFCIELENWRKKLEQEDIPKTVHPEVQALTNDSDMKNRTGRVFSIVPVMLEHAQTLITTIKKGWPPSYGGALLRPRTAGVLSSPRFRRSTSVTSMQPLVLGNGAKSTWRPLDAIVSDRSSGTLAKSHSMSEFPSLQRRRGSQGSITFDLGSDTNDEGSPFSRSSSPAPSSSSAYESGQPSLSHVSITNSQVTIASNSDNESTPWSPMDKKSIVKEISDALENKFDQELGRMSTRLEKKISTATETLRADIQSDLHTRDQRIDMIKNNVDQLSEFVEEKFADLDTEILRVNMTLKDFIKPLEEDQVLVVAQNIGPHVYAKLARGLGIRQTQLEWIQQKHQGDEHEVTIAILNKWRQSVGMRKATIETIIKTLVKVRERSTANQILVALKDS
ncbi:uncharacterized protein LOC144452934 [Glandiceps talaboti]